MDNTGLFITDSVYCFNTTVKRKREGERRCPQKICKTGVLPSTLILNFSYNFITGDLWFVVKKTLLSSVTSVYEWKFLYYEICWILKNEKQV